MRQTFDEHKESLIIIIVCYTLSFSFPLDFSLASDVFETGIKRCNCGSNKRGRINENCSEIFI